ncbi:MAG TPA: serine/threonine-protein kinase, partial [Candidatus Binatia bacterium]|nr:serine/threonine-protein kinase [Candidatus Binatia bacterium]
MNQCIGPYEILRELPEERVGRVYLATDRAKKKVVLVKSVRTEMAEEPEILTRLYSQAETLALLSHEHIARLFGFVRREDGLYLVMEHVEGQNLQLLLKEKGRLEIAVALAFFKQILSAVMYAHRLGVVHGDLNASNVIIRDFGRVKVLDFAIPVIFGNPDLTKAGDGSVRYMSPEQIDGAPVDVRSDIYSLGILLYELIVGRVPFAGTTRTESALRRRSTPLLPSLLVPTVPAWLDAFILRALAPAPAERFWSVAAMSQAMGTAVERHAVRASDPSRVFRSERSAQAAAKQRARSILQPQSSKASGVTVARAAMLAHQKRAAFAAFTARCGTVLNPTPCVRRWREGARAHSGAIRTALKARCGTVLGIPAAVGSALRLGLAAATRPTTAAAHGAARFASRWSRRCGEDLRKLDSRLHGLPEHAYRAGEALSETGWKRYVVLATVLSAVLIETFVFNGANTLFYSEIPPPSSAMRVETMPALPPSETPSARVALAKSEPPSESKVIKRANPNPPRGNDKPPDSGSRRQSRSLDRPVPTQTDRSVVAQVERPHNEALISRRTVTYRMPRADDEIGRPRPQEP